MYYELMLWQKHLIERVEKEFGTKYELKGDFISSEEIFTILDDVFDEYEYLKEKFQDFKKDVEDNYIQISVEDQIEGCK